MSGKKLARDGKRESKPGRNRSAAELRPPWRSPERPLLHLLEKVFDDLQGDERSHLGPEKYEQQRHDFAFHMTDWLNDLEGLDKLFADPERIDPKSARQFLIGFLMHVIPHLNAAGRLLLGEISDPFAPVENKK